MGILYGVYRRDQHSTLLQWNAVDWTSGQPRQAGSEKININIQMVLTVNAGPCPMWTVLRRSLGFTFLGFIHVENQSRIL